MFKSTLSIYQQRRRANREDDEDRRNGVLNSSGEKEMTKDSPREEGESIPGDHIV
jgi:hypothetical protein